MNTRILWTFAAAANQFKDDLYKTMAKRAYTYLLKYFRDLENGGLYWLVDYKGNPTDTKKQIYGQAFGIYGLSEYYKLTHDDNALNLAIELFDLIEEYSLDVELNGYLEAFDKDWVLLDDLRLSDIDANEVKTMNTHLHVLEAYTTLFEVRKDAKIRKALSNLVDLFLSRFINKDYHFNLF